MGEHIVAEEGDLDDGDRIVVQIEGRDVGVFRIDGEYYAYTSWCAHQGGPVCEGKLSGTTQANMDPETRRVELEWVREGEILVCPWHNWEFDAKTGQALARKHISIPSYPVRVENGHVVVSV